MSSPDKIRSIFKNLMGGSNYKILSEIEIAEIITEI